MTEPTPGHFVRAWVSRHDNGWEAWVCEDEHGDFDAFACPAASDRSTAETIGGTPLDRNLLPTVSSFQLGLRLDLPAVSRGVISNRIFCR